MLKRFRFTLLAVCLLLLFLGTSDLQILLRNPEPLPITLDQLVGQEPPRDWLRISGGVLDLTEAISTSGSIELDAFLVPLKTSADTNDFKVLVETRRPEILETLRTYHFKFDNETDQQRYLAEHRENFFLSQDVTGMVAGGLVASGNRDKLMQLAKELGMNVPDNVIFLSEGKEPGRWRGIFFLTAGLLGIVKLLVDWRKGNSPATPIRR